MAVGTIRVLDRVVAGLLIALVVLAVGGYFLLQRASRQADDDVRKEQARHAELVRGKLERLRDIGQLDEADVELMVRKAENGTLYSMTERPAELYVVASVGALGGMSFGVQSGPSYACYGFTVPDSGAPVTVERLSPDEGPWPDECRSVAMVP